MVISLAPSRTAVLLMDFQVGIVGRIHEPVRSRIVSNALDLLTRARAASVTVAYVRVAVSAEEAAAIPATNATFAAHGQNEAMRPDAPGTQVIDELAPRDDEIVVRKQRVGPFTTTDLREQLRARGVDTLVLTGISTSGVVLSTVRQGADDDFALVVAADAVADMDDEVHRVLMEKVLPKQAQVVPSGEIAFG